MKAKAREVQIPSSEALQTTSTWTTEDLHKHRETVIYQVNTEEL